MKYKLIDVSRETEEDVEFGTCDLCMHLGTLNYDIATFQDESGKTYEIEMGCWNWGDYIQFDIENYVRFAEWLSKKNIIGELDITGLIFDYKEESDYETYKGEFKESTLDYR